MTRYLLPALILCAPGTLAARQSPTIVVDTVATGFAVPKAILMLANSEALVASDRFRLSRLNLATGEATPVLGGPAPVAVRSRAAETAILDLAADPTFLSSGTIYLSVVVGDTSNSTLAVMRARLRGSQLTDTATLLTADAWSRSEAHFGGSVVVRDDYLFVSVGERESRERVQDLGNHVGKILRLHVDGRVPAGNPFAGRAGARPEIWSYGHRNPQGLAFDAGGNLWAHEHGPRHGDELNRIEPGRDYGWPRVSFGLEYTGGAVGSGFPTDSQSVAPLRVWTPAIAPSDLLIYDGAAFPSWRGNFLSTSLNNRRHLNRLVWDQSRFVLEEELFTGRLGRLRSVAQDAHGLLYLGNDAGQILRLRPAGGPRP